MILKISCFPLKNESPGNPTLTDSETPVAYIVGTSSVVFVEELYIIPAA